MTRKLTAQGGPLNGRTFLISDDVKTFTHHASPDGHYQANQKTATWKPAQPPHADKPEPEAPKG